MCYHFQFRLQAAGQDGEAVTEILFWDGQEEGIATYNYQPEAEFVNCDCCYVDPIPQVCVKFQCHLLTVSFCLSITYEVLFVK